MLHTAEDYYFKKQGVCFTFAVCALYELFKAGIGDNVLLASNSKQKNGHVFVVKLHTYKSYCAKTKIDQDDVAYIIDLMASAMGWSCLYDKDG